MHAAKTPGVDAYLSEFLRPAAPAPMFKDLTKGQQTGIFTEDTHSTVRIARTDTSSPALAKKVAKSTKLLKRNHYVLVGTNKANFMIVFFRTSFGGP